MTIFTNSASWSVATHCYNALRLTAIGKMVTTSEPIRGALQYSWFGFGFLTIFVPLLAFFCSRWANTDSDNNDENNNQDENNSQTTPWWFFGSNVNGAGRNEESAPPILIATYLWSLLVFSGILFFGFHSMQTGSDLYGIVVALVLFANYSLLSLFLLGGVEGAIETEGPAFDEHGFVGQFGVMMYMTGLLWVFYSTIFATILYRKAKHQNVIKLEVDQTDYESNEYRIHEPNTVTA